MELTILERLGIDSIINQQQGTLEELEVLLDIKRKLLITEDLRRDLFTSIPGGIKINEELLNSTAPIEVPLEKAERRKTLGLLKSYKNFTVDDLHKWLLGVLSKLEAVDK